ncbi:hypothetical protein JW756_02720 [Candidatus Woesearchaeota archaeon]|nr:hypothetical protein [Candidatus Woesearchaeota archaeon]
MNSQKRNQKICKSDNSDLCLVLESNFKRMLFEKLFDKHPSSECSKMFSISRGMLYNYKNNRVRSVPLTLIQKAIGLLGVEPNELNKHITRTLSSHQVRKFGLDFGRDIRINQLKSFKKGIPSVTEIMESGSLNLEKWFFQYKKLIDFGSRQFQNVLTLEDCLELTYTNYVKGNKKIFKVILPRKIRVDDDFLYFFGLWVGDKSSGGRLGVINKNKELNLYTAEYLKRLHQKYEFILYIHKNVKNPALDYKIDKVVRINSEQNGYAISVHAINGILKSFFDYLDADLDEFLQVMPKKNVFFAGLFDAEGNVCLDTRRFRWSCKNKRNIKIFSKHLKELNLFHRFDGCNLNTKNKEIFSKEILPYLKHPDKINKANLLCFGEGILPIRFKTALRFILDNPGGKHKIIAKALKKGSVSNMITFLERNGYIKKEGYPNRIFITNKGVASLSHGGKDI